MDISSKPRVERIATASGLIALSKISLDVVKDGGSPNGDVREACSIAAIQAVKETSRTLPHCHPIPIEGCSVIWDLGRNGLRCTVKVLSLIHI